MTAATLTLAGFLLARIAEDERARNVDLAPWPFDYSASDKAEAARWKAECEAKRRIVNMLTPECDRTDDRYSMDGNDWFVLAQLAAVYADHPDYRDEWKV